MFTLKCIDDIDRCKPQFSMKAVPPTLEDTVASLNGAASRAVGAIVVHLGGCRGICVRCHQPLIQHVPGIPKDETQIMGMLPLQVCIHGTLSQYA